MVTKGVNSGVESVFQAFPAENMHHYPSADLGIGPRNGLDIGQGIAYLRQGDSSGNVHQSMLPCGDGGDENRYCQDECQDPPPERELLLAPDAYVAHPACEAVKGREVIVTRVYGIEEPEDVVPSGVPRDLGPEIGRSGEENIAGQKDYLCRIDGAEEPLALGPVVLKGDAGIENRPDYVSAEIDDDGPGNQPERMVDRKGHVPMVQMTGNQSRVLIDYLVHEDRQYHRHEYVWEFLLVQRAHRLNFNKKGRF